MFLNPQLEVLGAWTIEGMKQAQRDLGWNYALHWQEKFKFWPCSQPL